MKTTEARKSRTFTSPTLPSQSDSIALLASPSSSIMYMTLNVKSFFSESLLSRRGKGKSRLSPLHRIWTQFPAFWILQLVTFYYKGHYSSNSMVGRLGNVANSTYQNIKLGVYEEQPYKNVVSLYILSV